MGRDRAEYGDGEDEMDVHRSEAVDDEEAQLLDGEDYEQFELDDASRPVLRSQNQNSPESGQPKPKRPRGRRTPRWLAFLYGPDPPKVYTINPWFPSVQELPIRWFEKAFPRPWQRLVLLVLFLVAWAVSLAVPLVLSKGTATDASGAVLRHVDCVDTLWRRNNECGLDGVDCHPFSNTSFAFRCPADCASVRVLNPHHVGPQDVNYRPLVIGGGAGSPYRGDSFLCGSAIHAGVVDDTTGGCGVATLTGEYYRYFPSSQHGIDSIPFDSYFPLSFTVTTDPAIKCTAPDPRWTISLPLSLLFTTLLSLLTTSPALLYFPTFLGIFAHVALISDPPAISTPSSTLLLPTLISHYAEHLLPSLFIATLLYHTTIRRTLASLPPTTALSKTLFWLLPLWLGALTNRTIEPLIPIARLTPSDLSAGQPGALLALITIITLITCIVAIQAYHLHQEGRLPRHLLFYLCTAIALAALSTLPHLTLRIHHYLLALLLLPGTALQTRLSLFSQGLLLGLFINGSARWGLASLLQTADALRSDGGFGGALIPQVVAPLIERLGTTANGGGGMRIWFKWLGLDVDGGGKKVAVVGGRTVEGISVLVNDVERFRGWFAEKGLEEQVFAWTRSGGRAVDEYFRFGFLTEGGKALDYSEAGTWFRNGTWSQGEGFY